MGAEPSVSAKIRAAMTWLVLAMIYLLGAAAGTAFRL